MAVASVKLEFITGPAAAAAGKIINKTDQLTKAMQKFQRVSSRAWDKFGNKVRKSRRVVQVNLEKIKRSFSGLNLQGALAGVGLGLFAKNAIQTAGNAQALEVRLKLLTQEFGEYEKAQEIASKAAKTFGMSNIEATEGVTNIIGRLRPLGVSLEDIKSTFFGFNTAAKLAGVSSIEASNAFRQLAQALGSGRLQGDEFRSLSEQVPTLLKPIAAELGTTVGKLKEFGAQGKITSDVVLRALKKIETEGAGKIQAIIDESSLQRFKDFTNAVENLSVAIGDELMPAITPLVKLMTKLVQGFADLNPVVKQAAIIVTALAAGLVIVIPSIVLLAKGFAALKAGIAVAGGLKILIGLAAVAGSQFLFWGAVITGVTALIIKLFSVLNKGKKEQKEFNDSLKTSSEKHLENALAIEKETLALINSGDIMDKSATKVQKRIEQLEKELGLREEMAKAVMTDKDREDIANELSMDKLNSGIIHPSLGGTAQVETQKEVIKLTEKEKQLRLEIKDILAQGMQNAIEGLIDGTKTLGQALADVAKSLASMFLQKGLQGMLGNMPFFAAATAADGAYFSNGIKPFASGGMATKPTLGLVGEAGEDEYIIPASKMAQSMQRYSSGARGESVIPGTGTSSSGGAAGSSTNVTYSGPILNFNSEEFVPKSAIGQIINSAASKGAAAGESRTMSTLRNSRGARSRLGM